MARWSTAVLFAAAVVLAAAAGVAAVRQDDFFVEGSVYYDTCHAGFETNATTPIAGARVRLECRHYMSRSGVVERSAEGATDAAGRYRVELVDNRGAEEVCVVALVSSPLAARVRREGGRPRPRPRPAAGGRRARHHRAPCQPAGVPQGPAAPQLRPDTQQLRAPIRAQLLNTDLINLFLVAGHVLLLN